MKRLVRFSMLDRDLQYRAYLNKHIPNTQAVWETILRPEVQSELDDDVLALIDKLIREHDLSKYSIDEWEGYLDHFYPDDGDPKNPKEVEIAYKLAWLHHLHNNPHHWNHWVLLDDDGSGKPEAIDMPLEHVLCMLSDWGSFRYGSPPTEDDEFKTTEDWYNGNKKHMIMTDTTKKLVEKYIKFLP